MNSLTAIKAAPPAPELAPVADTLRAAIEAGSFRRDPTRASYSALKQIARSPLHYLHYCREERKDTPAMAFGRAFHCYLLEPVRFASDYVEAPEFGDLRFKVNKEAKAAWLATAGEREPVAAADMDKIRAMCEAIMADELAAALVIGGHAEVALEWIDPRTRLVCRGKVDYHLPELRLAMDVKSVDNASPFGFGRAVAKFDYHVQDAMYHGGFHALGQPLDHFLFLCVESEPPHAVGVYYCDDAAKERGQILKDRWLDRLAESVATDHWPGYSEGLAPVSLPAWAFYND